MNKAVTLRGGRSVYDQAFERGSLGRFSYITLCGIIVSREQVRNLERELRELKLKIWNDGNVSFILTRSGVRRTHSPFYVDDKNPGIGAHIEAMLERRGKEEDKALSESYNALRESGTYWVSSERMKNTVQTHLIRHLISFVRISM